MPTRWVAQLLSNRSAMIGGLTLATVLAGPVISHSAHAATEPATTGGPAKLRLLSPVFPQAKKPILMQAWPEFDSGYPSD